ncbi:hypothetical protein H0H93_007424 [Arthromyces matolae]|nr:hypothetical protein H0H93_007424 [Arthromyces matolae]
MAGITTPSTITFEALREHHSRSGTQPAASSAARIDIRGSLEPLSRLLRCNVIYQLPKYIDPIAGCVVGKTASTKLVDNDDSKNDNKNKGTVIVYDGSADRGSATLYPSMHHKISTGNSLSDGKMGKVSNLEYARPYEEPVGHDPRTVRPVSDFCKTHGVVMLFSKNRAYQLLWRLNACMDFTI